MFLLTQRLRWQPSKLSYGRTLLTRMHSPHRRTGRMKSATLRRTVVRSHSNSSSNYSWMSGTSNIKKGVHYNACQIRDMPTQAGAFQADKLVDPVRLPERISYACWVTRRETPSKYALDGVYEKVLEYLRLCMWHVRNRQACPSCQRISGFLARDFAFVLWPSSTPCKVHLPFEAVILNLFVLQFLQYSAWFQHGARCGCAVAVKKREWSHRDSNAWLNLNFNVPRAHTRQVLDKVVQNPVLPSTGFI